MKIDYQGLIDHMSKTEGSFGLLTMQATSTTERLMTAFPERLKSLFSAEHGFFGTAAPGEKTSSAWHPYWNRPIHSLYGEHRRPTDEMLDGLECMVIDLCDIGVRCYTYLATIKNVLETCAEKGVAVVVLDRAIPLGGVLDGPLRKPEYSSFVAPLNIPFCHGMTPGECALWIKQTEELDLDLTVVKALDWNHAVREPWPNFIPPSPAIRSWDSAVFYPMLVFSEAYPAVDVDRGGSLAFRTIGAPWLDQKGLIKDLTPGLSSCGVGMRPYRYCPQSGRYAGQNLNGILFTRSNPDAYYPVPAGLRVYTALLQHHGAKMAFGARQEWFDKLYGSTEIRDTLQNGDLGELFTSWIDAQDEFLKTRVDLYQ